MPLKIVAYHHMACPLHNAGSEVAVHVAYRELARRGHQVTVIADRLTQDEIRKMAERGLDGFVALDSDSYEWEGVKVRSLPSNQFHHATVRQIAKDADVLITHLDCTSLAMTLAVDLDKPLVHFVHNHAQLGYWNVPPHKAQLVVFNTHWIAMNETYKGEPWPGRSIILHPIIEPEKYRCERGTKITFCNPTEGKGVETVHRLAEIMPDYEFLIVEGIYGEQVAPPHLNEEWERAHPNIEHMKNDPDFRNVLRKTKVLLMPSNYESYGRCAVEACCAGIPVIVHPTQGLWEALGDGRRYPAVETKYGVDGAKVTAQETLPLGLFDNGLVNGAGIFCRRYSPQNSKEPNEQDLINLESWKKQIERLYSDEVYYKSRSDAALKLAASFDPKSDFDRLEDALLITSQEWVSRNEVGKVKMWISDRFVWQTSDGKLVGAFDRRIPQDAIRQICGIGGEIPEDVARAAGFIASEVVEAKAIAAPEENKAMAAPEEIKAEPKKRPRKKKAA